jgi:hypothetical protein
VERPGAGRGGHRARRGGHATATPFDWRFTRTDLDRLLDRISAHDVTHPAPQAA